MHGECCQTRREDLSELMNTLEGDDVMRDIVCSKSSKKVCHSEKWFHTPQLTCTANKLSTFSNFKNVC